MSSTLRCGLFCIQYPAEELPIASHPFQNKIQNLYPGLYNLAPLYIQTLFFLLTHTKLILTSETLCLIFTLSGMIFPDCHDYFLFFLRFYLYCFRERGREGEREREKHQCVREASIGCLLHAPQVGTWPATQACALIGNWTGNLSPCETMLNQLSHTSRCWWLTSCDWGLSTQMSAL